MPRGWTVDVAILSSCEFGRRATVALGTGSDGSDRLLTALIPRHDD